MKAKETNFRIKDILYGSELVEAFLDGRVTTTETLDKSEVIVSTTEKVTIVTVTSLRFHQ